MHLRSLSSHWLHNPENVWNFQKVCGVEKLEDNGETVKDHRERNGSLSNGFVHKPIGYRIRSRSLHYLMKFSSFLGQEEFYVSFFTFCYWNVDRRVAKEVIFVWAIGLFFGQLVKEWLKWPRPKSPPVVYMENLYLSEFGMPSTHAIVGVCIPFSFLFFSHTRYDFCFPMVFAVAAVWTVLVCISRLYMGMHSYLEVIVGFVSGVALLMVLVPIANSTNYWLVTSSLAPLTVTSVTFALSSIYPNEGSWTKSWADSVAVIATPAGFDVGVWLLRHYGFTGTLIGPLPIYWPSIGTVCLSFLRTALGLLCVLVARLLVKKMSYPLVSLLSGTPVEELKREKRIAVEMSIKYFTYFHMSLATSLYAPLLFWKLSIDTHAAHTDF